MKLSRTGWNNVIIFSVMMFILVINATNKKLFNDDDNQVKGEQLILPEHSVILALSIKFPDKQSLLFERLGRQWQMTAKGVLLELNQQKIQQMIRSWQQSSGLVQVADIMVEGSVGVQVTLDLADNNAQQGFTLYALSDQLLVYNQQTKLWLALPAAMAKQLLPTLKTL